MRLLVTRPQPDAERTAQALRWRGHAVVVASLMHPERLDAPLPVEACDALVMTSANAARALAGRPELCQLAALPVFAVGRHTAEAAQAAGFGNVRCAYGDKSDLVELIAAHGGGKAILYLAGADRSGDLAGDLAERGLRVHTAVVYRAVQAARFPNEVVTALRRREIDGVTHFSRRSAQAYLDCAAHGDIVAPALEPAHFCLSGQVAEPLVAAGARQVRTAARPQEAALLAAIG